MDKGKKTGVRGGDQPPKGGSWASLFSWVGRGGGSGEIRTRTRRDIEMGLELDEYEGGSYRGEGTGKAKGDKTRPRREDRKRTEKEEKRSPIPSVIGKLEGEGASGRWKGEGSQVLKEPVGENAPSTSKGGGGEPPKRGMASVRRSSLFEKMSSEKMTASSKSPPTKKRRRSKQSAKVGVVSEKDTHSDQEQAIDGDEDEEGAETEDSEAPPPSSPGRRRNSSGSASSVNAAHTKSKIRQRQSRRFRAPRQSVAVKYLQYFLACLYYIGMSPVKPASAQQLPKWFLCLQVGFYWVLSIVSVLDAFGDAKYGWINFRAKSNMINFLTFGYFLANCITRIYYIIVLQTSGDGVSKLVKKIDRVNSHEGTPRHAGWALFVAVAIGSLSMLAATVSILFSDIALQRWTFKRAMLSYSYDFSDLLLVWSSENYEEVLHQLFEKYGTKLTPTTEWFAVAGSFLRYCGTLHGCVILDLWPIITIQIYFLQSHFSAQLEKTKRRNRTGRCPLSIHWDHYMRLRKVCDDNEKIFGTMLKLIHMQNLLLFGYFLLTLMDKKDVNVECLVELLTVVKVSVTYYMIQKAGQKNQDYEECVRECSGDATTIEMGGRMRNVANLLKGMKNHPIGVGRGDFFVNEAFIIKFVLTVGSIFMLLASQSQEEMLNCEKFLSDVLCLSRSIELVGDLTG